ncbi:MAG: hypothetical protein M0P12_10295 [Paludibacteraceae bacterium]|nr:hypothetical protein [Paludibacteraceae bacterium]
MKKLYILLIISILILNQHMHKSYAIFAKFIETCKDFADYLVDEAGNVRRRGIVPKLSDLKEIAFIMTAKALSIDSENYLFSKLAEYKSSFSDKIFLLH